MTARSYFGMFLLAAMVVATGLAVVGATTAQASSVVTIVNLDGANEGFNDPTAAAPVGGNPGTTVGQQRLIAFQFAADIWGATLDSNVPIIVNASFDPLSCNATSATLGSSGATFIYANFAGVGCYPGAEFPNTWYSSALAKKRAGYDLNPGQADMRARFNSNLGNTGCLTGIGWYYGLDAIHGTKIDLVTVLLHEFAHGLGFQQFASLTNGSESNNYSDQYRRYLLDTTTGLTWDQMTNAQRVASAINTNRVVWNGPIVTATLPGVLSPGTPLLTIDPPASIAGTYAVGTASYGPPLSSPGVSGDVVLANDGVAPIGDGCSAFTPGSLAGKIALIDRGTCTFTIKVKFAQDAGAVGVIIADNAAGAPPAGLGGTDPTITIPSVRVTLADGNLIKAALLSGTVHATLGVNLAVYAGADPAGRVIMNSPNPVQTGSSISHWDPIAFRNQLMEPAINDDLTHSVKPPEDLTLPLFREIGWFPDANLNGVPDENECQIACLPNTTIPADPGRCDAVFNYELTTTGLCCGVVTSTPPSGSTFPLGTTTVTATSPSGAACSFTVTVVDTQAPLIANAVASPLFLWPVNHKMWDINVAYDSSDSCSAVNSVLSVTCNEPANALGDGNTSPDWEIVNNHLVRLRAERSGTGDGRVYTITITSTDEAGNSSSKAVVVEVKKSQGDKPEATRRAAPTAAASVPTELSFDIAGRNPALSAASFRFGLPGRAHVVIDIFDVNGRRVAGVIESDLEAGWHTASWNAVEAASRAGSGVYFARLTADGVSMTRRVLIR